MIAAARFIEAKQENRSAAEFVPGLRRIDELLPLVLARYCECEPAEANEPAAPNCQVSSAESFTRPARSQRKVLPR